MNNILVNALRGCETKEEVEDTFSKFEVANLPLKQQYLNTSMGNPEVFFSGTTTPDSAYLTTRAAFITGAWKD
jgi:hypothetical protein